MKIAIIRKYPSTRKGLATLRGGVSHNLPGTVLEVGEGYESLNKGREKTMENSRHLSGSLIQQKSKEEKC